MIPEEHRQFLESHRLCVVGFARHAGPPSLSPTYYYLDGDDICISTTAGRAKARAVQRNPEVTVCVLGEQQPFPYLTVYGRGVVEPDRAVEAMRRAGEAMTGNPVPDAALPALEQRARDEGRVLLRITPESFFSTRTMGPRSG
jgi:PPOX class probable F420-dependent enzyme